jgi:glycosyltransferase involved in cell wall biosynthesis
MNILFICKTLPHEKVIGGPIIVYNRIRLLSERHRVSLLTFVIDEERPQIHTISRFCWDFAAVNMPPARSRLKRVWDFLFAPVPPYFMHGYSPEMYARLREIVRSKPYDVVISEYSLVAQYLYRNPDLEGIKRVMSVHECYWLARKKAFRVQRFSREGVTALFQLKGLRRFEFSLYRSADRILVLTPQGKEELLALEPGLDISVVPHGVDIDHFSASRECVKEQAIMFLGNYPHDPNRDAVLYFYDQIWPRIKREVPETRFYVVGKDPTPDIRELASKDPAVIVTGTVEDVRPYFERCKVFVCPVRIGGGFRGKILEAMAMGLPIVTTSLGAEGVAVSEEGELIIADDPEDFASKTVELLSDDGLCERIGVRARKMVEECFSWEHGVKLLEQVLYEVVAQGH